jgi:hypothetical protein
MTATASMSVLDTRPARAALPVPVVLGLQEGRRIVLHPIALAGFALMTVLVVVVGDNGSRDAFDVVTNGPTFFYGVFTYFAANLVASRDRRAHSGELLAALPSSRPARVAGLCVAALVPAAVCTAFVTAVHASSSLRDLYVVAPDVWHLAQGPLTVLGGALLGIMVARWTSLPGVALLVMIAMILFNAWISEHDAEVQPLGTYVTWATWAPHPYWAGMEPGSPAWHAAYLVALCAMAACGSFLRETGRPWRVLGLGAVLTALAVVPAVAQLP